MSQNKANGGITKEDIRRFNIERKMKAIFQATKDRIVYGRDRWLDEKEYEEIDDYAIMYKSEVEANGGKFVKMTKRPFGFVAEIEGVRVQFSANSESVSAKVAK